MEESTGELQPSQDREVIRVTRHRKRRRSSANKSRPWYKSKRLRNRLEVFGKMVLVVLVIGSLGVFVWLIQNEGPHEGNIHGVEPRR